jgi:hypothetical protein
MFLCEYIVSTAKREREYQYMPSTTTTAAATWRELRNELFPYSTYISFLHFLLLLLLLLLTRVIHKKESHSRVKYTLSGAGEGEREKKESCFLCIFIFGWLTGWLTSFSSLHPIYYVKDYASSFFVNYF